MDQKGGIARAFWSHDDDDGNDGDGDYETVGVLSSSTTPSLLHAPSSLESSNLSSPTSKKGIISAESPRWRFVNKAKKTEGYSSAAAGTVVTGMSAQELAGKFIAPEWNESRKEALHVDTGISDDEEVYEGNQKMMMKVGRLEIPNEYIGDDAMQTQKYERRKKTVDNEQEESSAMITENEELEQDESSAILPDNLEKDEEKLSQSITSDVAAKTGSTPENDCVEVRLITPNKSSSSKRSTKIRRMVILLFLAFLAAIAAVLGILLTDDKKDFATNEVLDMNESSSILPTYNPTFQSTYITNNSTTMPSSKPTSLPSTISQTPSFSPRPSNLPTNMPTCDVLYENFNLCIALDMSGSVCNSDTGFECLGCEPELICKDSDVDKGTCCNNFNDLIEFAKALINALATISDEASFTIVPFATDAKLASAVGFLSDEASAGLALASLDALTYTGGRTNHAKAINICRTSLEDEDRKKILLLITDGNPSEPANLPEIAASTAATDAKSEGIFIIPVMIKQWQQPYLQGISSDGTVFDASDFNALDTLLERLLEQVSCQV